MSERRGPYGSPLGDYTDLRNWSVAHLATALRAEEDALAHEQVVVFKLLKEIDRRDGLIARLARRRGPLFDNAERIEFADVRADTARRYHHEQKLSLRQTALKMGTSVRQVCRWLGRPTKD